MSDVNKFCAACANALVQDPSLSRIAIDCRSHHNSSISLINALDEGCFICTAFWANLSETSRTWWTEPISSENSERCTSSRLYPEECQEGIFRFSIALQGSRALSANDIETRFYLVATEMDCEDQPAPLDIAATTSSQATFDLALKWYEACQNNHNNCCKLQNYSGSCRPTRLIEIGSPENDHWKLCILGDQETGLFSQEPYITLSYRWSLHPDILLKQSAIHEFVKGGPINRLPQTFQDAIFVARKFSIKYIWIDAFCIIQDSEEDWNREAPSMRYVYANSAFNIAASAAEDQFSGLFRSRDPAAIRPAVFKAPNVPSWIIYEKNYWDRQFDSGPLHSRGWVFQECLLAPRVLYFGKNQILWECLTGAKCEAFANGIFVQNSHKSLDPLLAYCEDGLLSRGRRGILQWPTDVHELWEHLVERYSLCQLTKPSDRLRAFAGIAELFRELTGDEYVAGLWRSRILDQIHWTACQPKNKQMVSSQPNSPSWSWASVDGPIKQIRFPSSFRRLVKLVNVQNSSNATALSGIGYGAILTLSGLLTQIHMNPPHFIIGDHLFQGSIYPDHLELEQDMRGMLYLLPLQTWSFTDIGHEQNGSVYVAGLVLQHNKRLPIFCRWGYFTTSSRQDIKNLKLLVPSDGLVSLPSYSRLSEVITI